MQWRRACGDHQESPPRDRPRDNQRSRVYRAEMVIADSGLRFADLDACRAYCAELIHDPWIRHRFDLDAGPGRLRSVDVRDGRGSRHPHAWFELERMALPRVGRTEPIVLHELAHLLVSSPAVAPHGPEFAAGELALVDHRLGASAAAALASSFAAHRVRW